VPGTTRGVRRGEEKRIKSELRLGRGYYFRKTGVPAARCKGKGCSDLRKVRGAGMQGQFLEKRILGGTGEKASRTIGVRLPDYAARSGG